MSESTFQAALAQLINRHWIENRSGTPAHVLAEYMMGCLRAYEAAVLARDKCQYRHMFRSPATRKAR